MPEFVVDMTLAKSLGLTEKDFEGKNEDEQFDLIDSAVKKLKKSWKSRSKPEYFDNATKELQKIKELFKSPALIYVKPIPPSKSITAFQVVGYSPVDDKVLAIQPDSEAEKRKIYQLSDDQIIMNEEAYKEVQKKL
jgi:hypothetical protein